MSFPPVADVSGGRSAAAQDTQPTIDTFRYAAQRGGNCYDLSSHTVSCRTTS
jgi:hypothetical protein